MAKGKIGRGGKKTKRAKKSATKPLKSAAKARKRTKTPPKAASRKRRAKPARAAVIPVKAPRLNRARRTLSDIVPTPPSSLDMDRHASAARSGRAEIQQEREQHRTMTPAITAGDVDVDLEDAYFTGDEAPGGDNPTPDQDVVDDIGKALGVEYQDNEALHSTDKLEKRDRHRWELDPASSEDYKDRK